MAVTSADLMDAIAKMTVLELSDLIKQMKRSLACPLRLLPLRPAAGAGASAAAEQTEFSVILKAAGDNKVNAIR